MKRSLFVLLALTFFAACGDDVHVTAPCQKWTTITQRGLHADTSVTVCQE